MKSFQTAEQVHNHAKKSVGKTILELNNNRTIKKTKSSVGDAFENWFDKKKDSDSKPDIEEAGVELKATAFKKLKNGQYSAKERLVLNIINYEKIVKETFENSHFLFKNRKIEIAFYEYLKNVPKDEWTIKEVVLYEMSKNKNDYEIIKQDWNIINDYVQRGKAHELSERLTQYLSPCTKGANAKTVRIQPFSNILAKQRAYSLKSGYMTSILRKYVFGNKKSESIIKDPFILKENNIEEIIKKKFEPYVGKSITELKELFNIHEISYQVNYKIAASILNLNGNFTSSKAFERVEEFEKACIVVKTIKFNENNVNKESMSFPAFKFEELSKESWVNELGEPQAEWHNYLLESRFLFVIIKTHKNIDYLKGIKFFSVPDKDLQGPIRKVWEDTVKKINEGVELKATPWGKKTRITNNFISLSDNLICHVRPHGSVSDYSEYGSSADKLPVKAKWINKPNDKRYSDQWMTSQSFWFNRDYIKEQVKDLLDTQ